jgi:alpha-aminoadipic semialdehyde synthase
LGNETKESSRLSPFFLGYQVYGKELLQNAWPFDAWDDLSLECLPNRDSMQYENTYGIANAKTIFRGTLRYRGFSSLMNVFQNIGMFDTLPTGASTWNELLDMLRMRKGGFESLDDFLLACADDDMDTARRAKECLEWLEMTGDSPVPNADSLLDLFCSILEEKLQYGPDERDMVAMHHTIDAQFEDGRIEHHQSRLRAFGDSSMSSMCKTVGYTTAAATDVMLSGVLDGQTGLLLPTTKVIYKPILDAVEKEGIVFSDTCTVEQPLAGQRAV